jgi:hypothetical protein
MVGSVDLVVPRGLAGVAWPMATIKRDSSWVKEIRKRLMKFQKLCK